MSLPEWLRSLARDYPSQVLSELQHPDRNIPKEERERLFSLLASDAKIRVWASQHSDRDKYYVWGLIPTKERIEGARDQWSGLAHRVAQALSSEERAILERLRQDDSVVEEEDRLDRQRRQEQNDYYTAMREKPPRDHD